MALTTYGKNQAINALGKGSAPTKWMEYVTLMEGTVYAAPSVSSAGGTIKSTGGELIAKGKLVVKGWVMIEAITGGTGSEGAKMLVVGRPYLVKAVTETTVELMEVEGGPAIKPETEVTAITFCALVESATARVATAFAGASEGESADTAKVIEVGAGKKVRYAAWTAHVSSAAAENFMAITKLQAEESFGSAGKYELTSDKLEANPATVA